MPEQLYLAKVHLFQGIVPCSRTVQSAHTNQINWASGVKRAWARIACCEYAHMEDTDVDRTFTGCASRISSWDWHRSRQERLPGALVVRQLQQWGGPDEASSRCRLSAGATSADSELEVGNAARCVTATRSPSHQHTPRQTLIKSVWGGEPCSCTTVA